MMEVTLAIISAIVTLGVAYIGIIPKLKEDKKNRQEELLCAIKEVRDRLSNYEKSNDEHMASQSEALMLIMRSNLHSIYDKIMLYEEPPKDEIRDWWERYDSYKKLGGNHSIDRLAEVMQSKGYVE